MSKPNKQYDYYSMKVVKAEFLLQFDSLKDLLRYAESHHQKSIFVVPAQNGTEAQFAFSHKGGILQHPTLGFETLEDYSASLQNGFADAETFYAARQLGFSRYTEYKMSTETGITDARAYEEIKKEGYIDGYAMFDKERTENPALPQLENITNAHQLKQWVSEQKLDGLQEFKESWLRGFTNALEYRTAKELGYKTQADYSAGTAAAFRTAADFYYAKEKGIHQIDDYYRYLDLEGLQLPLLGSDLKVLLVIVSKLPDGKKTSLTKLHQQWQTEVETYRLANGELPAWFTTTINTVEEFANVLATHQALKKYGSYDTDGEFFENKKLRDRMIIVDGSNVAHGSPGKHREKPTLRHVLMMVNFLKAKGFTDITVFSDAALKHRLEDSQLLKDIKGLCTYNETPANTTADLFLISFVKRHHCLIVSNDTFREWKMTDSWVAENMDFYRLSFMINDTEVIMPDVE